jgi:predicted enzyme related to lactoylglutathione lyase
MSKIVHTELISNDARATADFVGKVFGWKVDRMDAGNMEYYIWNYAGEKMGGGGIANVSSEHRDKVPHINIFVDVENLAAALEKAKSLGAAVLVPEMEIPNGMGYFIVLSAPGGVTIGIWSQKGSK